MSIRVPRQMVLVVLLFAAGAARAGDGEQSRLSEKLRALVARHVKPDGPGAVLVLARNGAIIAQAACGYSDVDKKVRLSPNSVFDLASCSKQFTAMAVMILADRGKLSFEDDARQFLPELAPRDPPVHVCDLLHMTSGLPDYEKLLDHLEDKTNPDVLHAVAARPLLFPTGSKFNYCDTNYVLLALIGERVSGESFARFLKSEVFDPAGMKQSMVLEAPGESVEHRATGYAQDKSGAVKPTRLDTRSYGDGQVMTTALDLVKWDQALRQNALVRPQTLALAVRSGMLSDGRPCGYGFGWFIDKNGKAVDHAGKWFGTSTYIRRQLDDGLTIIVLSNLEQFPAKKVALDAAAMMAKLN